MEPVYDSIYVVLDNRGTLNDLPSDTIFWITDGLAAHEWWGLEDLLADTELYLKVGIRRQLRAFLALSIVAQATAGVEKSPHLNEEQLKKDMELLAAKTTKNQNSVAIAQRTRIRATVNDCLKFVVSENQEDKILTSLRAKAEKSAAVQESEESALLDLVDKFSSLIVFDRKRNVLQVWPHSRAKLTEALGNSPDLATSVEIMTDVSISSSQDDCYHFVCLAPSANPEGNVR